jgi:GMP synthase (glutamine-hydrolysing)
VSSLPVLLVEHEAQCPPGWVGEWLAEAGCRLDVRRPYRGDALPERLDEHAGMVVLGGSMHAGSDHDHPWLGPVKQLVRGGADNAVPVLGICLGHQLAAVALGGVVQANPRGQQVGVLPVGWTSAAAQDPLMAAVCAARVALHWNSDVVTVAPAGSEVLAETTAGELQAARFAPTVWGVQWHPEVGERIVSVWAEEDRDSVAQRGLDVDEYVAAVAAAHDELRRGWQPLAARFAALARDAAPTW